MGEVLLVSSDSVCGVLDWGNWVFRLVFEGEAIQRISKYKSYKRMCKNLKILFFFLSFQLLSSQVVNTLKRALIICISIQARRWKKRGTGCQLSLSNMRSSGIGSTCWHSWALSSVPLLQFGAHSVLRCSCCSILSLCHYVPKFWEVPRFSVLQTFFPSLYEMISFFWISFIHLGLLFCFVWVRYRFEVREFASSGFCATIGPKLISPSLKDTREIQRWERERSGSRFSSRQE